MKVLRFVLVAFMMCSALACQKDLTGDEIVEGLKEALRVGTANSVASANQTDGYFGNAFIKIPFPEEAQFVANAVALVYPQLIDDLVLKLNRAAEDAADEAKPIFLNAITNITFGDAMSILNGSDDAATQYLKSSTFEELKAVFKPDINNSLSTVGAAKAWSDVTVAYNQVPFHKPVNTDLADYTTGKALDGMFYLVAQEEAKIRKDPAARVSDILQKVFGSK